MMFKFTITFYCCLLFFIAGCSHFSSVKIKGNGPKEKLFRVLWVKNNDPAHVTGNLPIAFNAPFAYQGILYAGHNEGYMTAYELESGRVIWRKKDLGGYHAFPIVYKDQLIYGTTDGRIYSRNYLSGKMKYELDLGASVESAGVIYKGRILFHLRNHKIFCLDVESGKILWAYKRSVPYLTTLQRVSKPLVVNNRVYVGMADGYLLALSIEEGMLLWEKKIALGNKFIDVDTGPVMYKNKLFVASLSGPLVVLNPNTGDVIQHLEYNVSRAPIPFPGGLLLGTVDGELILLNDGLALIKRRKVSQGSISSMVVWNNKLIVSTIKGELQAHDLKTFTLGEKLHLGHTSSAIFGPLVVHGDKLALISSRNRLYVFKKSILPAL